MVQVEIINYILAHQDCELVRELDINDFSELKQEFQYIKDHLNKYGSLPTGVNFVDKFPDFEVLEPRISKQALIDDLKDDKKVRIMIDGYNKVWNILHSSRGSISEKAEEMTLELARTKELLEKETTIICVNKTDNLIDLFKERQERPRKLYYDTGIDWLDNVCYGWDKNSDYVTIAGRPGSGKSMMLCKLAAYQLTQGRTVLYYSGEMPMVQVQERIISSITGISMSAIFRGDSTIQEQYCDFVKNKFSSLKLTIITPQELGGKYARASQLEEMAKKIAADIVFIDQQSLMTDEECAKVGYEKAANISRQIKAMRDRLNIPVITAVQLNRMKTEDGVSNTIQIAGSDVIGQDSTKVIILSETTSNSDEIEIELVKNRNGKAHKKHKFFAEFDTCTFIDKDDYSEGTKIIDITENNECEPFLA